VIKLQEVDVRTIQLEAIVDELFEVINEKEYEIKLIKERRSYLIDIIERRSMGEDC